MKFTEQALIDLPVKRGHMEKTEKGVSPSDLMAARKHAIELAEKMIRSIGTDRGEVSKQQRELTAAAHESNH